MDTTVMMAKVLESRKKSIAKIQEEIGSLMALQEKSTPDQKVALQGLITVREQRVVKLKAELQALAPLADARQLELGKGPRKG